MIEESSRNKSNAKSVANYSCTLLWIEKRASSTLTNNESGAIFKIVVTIFHLV